ncbi:MAG: tannase/feruloyl esterase family alpha/beta hydrolase [Pseudomonadota bacterium]
MEFAINVSVVKHLPLTTIAAAASACVLMSACSGGSDPDPGLLATRASPASACSALAGMAIAPARIGLPTTGGTVDSATFVAANASGNSNGEYCLVQGAIHPASAGAPDIKFQANLPTNWNKRSLHMGGSGYNGAVVTGLAPIAFAPTAKSALSRGYATFGSDSGHQSALAVPSSDASFALNDEALQNYGYAHIKKTHDAVVEVLKAYFGANVDFKSYFAGGSTGGREALTAVQRFPADYDGVYAGSPTAIFWGVRMAGFPVGRAAYATPGGYLNQAKQALVYQRSTAACDALDGVADGLVSNVSACKAIAATTSASLRCASGTDEGNHCLSDAQLGVINTLHNGLTLPYEMAFNSTRYSGYNALEGTDFSVNNFTLGLGNSATLVDPLNNTANGYLFAQGAQWLRYFVAKDPTFNPLSFDPQNPGLYKQRIVDLSAIVGAENPDLSAFKARGGKLIMLQGLADTAVSPNGTIDYYGRVVNRLGQNNVDEFLRFYTVPGMGHGVGAFVPSWDVLAALDAWVSEGSAPNALIGTDTSTATLGRTRPLCRFPAWPKYQGSGDVNAASSFACSTL